MKTDTQRAILRACARFTAKLLTPIVKRLDLIEKATADLVRKSDVESMRTSLEKRLDQAIREPGPKGEPGRDAEPIALADVVAELVRCTEIRPVLALLLHEYMVENPLPLPKDGKDGDPGPEGPAGATGQKGADGADGVGLADAVINRDGELVITTTRGNAIRLGAVIGKDGAPGKDGIDGEDFTDTSFDYDGERTLTIFGKGGKGGGIAKHLPIPLDRGYWREGMACEKSDIVTHDGSAWLALRDTKAKPSHADPEDWRLFARKGRDGAQGPAGKDYKPDSPVSLK